ncbi:MAG TPA: hypothetical protein DEP53_11115 [Bacteroidetes bacterium]|nr:hypothetical protein [Bacteroidota bacterium]
MRTIIVCFGLLAVLVVGCSGTGEGTRMTSSREILNADEIAKTSALNAYDAVRMRRPEFLAPRTRRLPDATTRSAVRPVVYLNEVYHGDVESLRHILIREIKEIRYLDAEEATLMYGSDHVAGVINVTTKIN